MQVFYMLAFVLLLLGVAVVVRWQHHRANEIVKRWAQAIGVELVSAQVRYWKTGPFVFYLRGQFVFRIVVSDGTGTQRSGWILVGSWHSGVLSDTTKVIWDS
jgi:hypothetical protein